MLLRVITILTVIGSLTGVGMLAGSVPARADEEDPMPGRAYASSFGEVPANTAITVKPWDNSSANLRLKSSFSEQLSKRGVRLTETGTPLLLNFDTEIESLASPSLGPTLGQVQGRNWDSRVRMNVWSNQQDSVLAGRKTTDPGLRTVRYILRATLDDQRNGQRIWQGEASYTGAPADEANAFVAMVPVMVEGFGQNVRPKGFRLD